MKAYGPCRLTAGTVTEVRGINAGGAREGRDMQGEILGLLGLGALLLAAQGRGVFLRCARGCAGKAKTRSSACARSLARTARGAVKIHAGYPWGCSRARSPMYSARAPNGRTSGFES